MNSPYCSSIAWIIQHLPPLKKKRIPYIPIHTSPSMVNVRRRFAFCSSASELQEANPFFFPVHLSKFLEQLTWVNFSSSDCLKLQNLRCDLSEMYGTTVWCWFSQHQKRFNYKTYTCIHVWKKALTSPDSKIAESILCQESTPRIFGMKFEAFHHQHFLTQVLELITGNT